MPGPGEWSWMSSVKTAPAAPALDCPPQICSKHKLTNDICTSSEQSQRLPKPIKPCCNLLTRLPTAVACPYHLSSSPISNSAFNLEDVCQCSHLIIIGGHFAEIGVSIGRDKKVYDDCRENQRRSQSAEAGQSSDGGREGMQPVVVQVQLLQGSAAAQLLGQPGQHIVLQPAATHS